MDTNITFNLIDNNARYSDGRKVCLGDVVRWVLLSGEVGEGRVAFCDDSGMHITVRTEQGDFGMFLHDKSLMLHQRSSRREWFKIVCVPLEDWPVILWHKDCDADGFSEYDSWLDKPMFNDGGGME